MDDTHEGSPPMRLPAGSMLTHELSTKSTRTDCHRMCRHAPKVEDSGPNAAEKGHFPVPGMEFGVLELSILGKRGDRAGAQTGEFGAQSCHQD